MISCSRLLAPWLIFLAIVTGGSSAAPAVLTLGDLANHPERWPETVTLQKEFKFDGGASAKKGQSVRVLDFNGATVAVDAGRDLTFEVLPAETNLLAAANKVWTQFTLAQREIDSAALLKDPSLWPFKVKATAGFRLENGTDLPPGGEYDLISYTAEGAWLYSAKYRSRLLAELKAVDAVARGREIALIPRDERPARIPLTLEGKLVDADGNPATVQNLKEAQLFGLYFGASWCPPCRAFSPSLVKFVREVAPANPRLVIVMVSEDEKDAELFAYMKKENMPWPAITMANAEQPAFLAFDRGGIPQFVICDRFGKVYAESFRGQNYVGPQVPLAVLSKMVKAGAGK